MTKPKLQIKNRKFILRSVADTQRLARRIAQSLHGGEVLALTGPLGAGKTTFTAALAKSLGVKRRVKSPTFIVLQTFRIPLKARSSQCFATLRRARKLKANTLCHVDAYRLESTNELEALGLHDYLGAPNVITVIEWAEKIGEALPHNSMWLHFDPKEKVRIVTFTTGNNIKP